MAGPLDGIKVVELGVWVAGPAAGGIMADWGADVVKIEPPTGDPGRSFGRMIGLDDGSSPPFEMDNRSQAQHRAGPHHRRRTGDRAPIDLRR